VGSLFLRQAWRDWRHAIVRQGTTTIVCRCVRRTLAHLFVSFVSYWHNVKCNGSYWYKGFLGKTAQRTCLPTGASGFCHCDRVPSSTSSSTTSSGIRGSYAYIFGLCSAATQQGFTPSYFIGFCDNIVSTHTKVHRGKWSARVHCDQVQYVRTVQWKLLL